VKRKMLATLHVDRRLNEEQGVMVARAGGAQERAGVDESVGHLEAEALDIELFRHRQIRHETDDVRERARAGGHVLPDAQLIDGALRGRAGRIDALWRQIQGAARGHLKAQSEAVIVLRLHSAVGEERRLPVFRQFLRDRSDCGRVGDAIDRLAQHGAGFQRGRQAGIVAAQGCSVLDILKCAPDSQGRKCLNLFVTTRIGGCPVPASLLEILRSIPDHRRAEGKRFDLGTVLLYAVLSMVSGANSYRQMHEFIRIHLHRLNEAFGLELPYSPSYTGLRLILQGVDRSALEAAFRQHASSISPPASDGLVAVAIDGKTLRGSFDAFSDRKAAHMMSALRQADQIVLGHLMVEEKSNEIPAAPELIEALGLRGCVFTLDAEHAQKNCSSA